jgi:predicted nuclease of restriction endonuclease-like RecB superfamily
VDPRELRRAIFEKMAQHHPVPLNQEPQYPLERSALLTEIGEQFEMSLEQVEHALYSDLQDAYVMTDFKDTNPQALLERYNLAQAQALLFRATHLRLELWDTSAQRLRQLVRYIKFYQLISWIQPLASQRYRIELDGPMSLFRFCQKYGLQMANFLPALLLCENWSMEAEIQWEDKRKKLTFKLDHETDLQSHYPDKGVYVTGEELHFRKQWKKKNKTQWSLEPKARTLRLGSQDVLVTDYTLSHEDGREAEIYIVGFWQRQTLIRKLELIEEHAPPNVIVLAPARLRASQDDLDSISDRLLFYKQVIPTKKVVALAEEHAIIPD